MPFPYTLPFTLGLDSVPGTSKNLRPYQMQIGEIVLGRGTPYTILGTNIQAYNVNNQDSQIPLSDQITFGQDSFAAQPVILTIGVRDNAPMRYIPNTLPADLVEKSAALLDALQDEWFANDIKQSWNQMEPLTFCNGYGVIKQIWGRPRKFQYSPKTETSQFRKVTAEFARVDPYAYAEIESLVELTLGADPVFHTLDGTANSWLRVLLTGPMSNPLVTLGSNQIQLGMDIVADTVVEVSSYPWSQRIIDSTGISWRNKLIGQTKYLDQLILPKKTSIPMSWSATNTSSASKCQVLWLDAYNII